MYRKLLLFVLLIWAANSWAETLKFEVKGASFNMIFVEGGSFMMGATAEQQPQHEQDELPIHRETLEDYYIGETEVTQQLWTAVMGHNPSFFYGNELRPVENVSWVECQQFIKKLNDLLHTSGQLSHDMEFALPTEAQWEYAARGGKKSKQYRYSGSSMVGDVAWYYYSKGVTHVVGRKAANELGLHDMTGNVFEWCHDWYHLWNPNEVPQDTARVLRGGSWSSQPKYCRVSKRFHNPPTAKAGNFGLRLAINIK